MSNVEISDISVSFGSLTVIDTLTLTIPDGEFFTLLGPSGCGKTTLLRVIAGFIRPEKGLVKFGDQDVTSTPPHLRDTGMVFQDYALFPDKTVFDNIAYGLRARKVPSNTINKKVDEHLELVGLADFGRRLPSKLSGGQRQRVALARALVISPKVLLLDEPLSALDAKLRREMQSLIRSIQQEVGVTAVFVTHDQREALAMSDRIALMRGGKIEQLAPPEKIFHRPNSTYAADFIGRANLLPTIVKRTTGKTALCNVAGTDFEVAANGCTKKDQVRLCVHHQEIHLSSTRNNRRKLPVGEVTEVTFEGRHVNYDVEISDGNSIKVQSTTGFGAPVFSRGETVHVEISNNACLVKD